jgi:fumarate hydratase class I
MALKQKIINLYQKTATVLPLDVVKALTEARQKETSSAGKDVLDKILENIRLAKAESKPLCQDTGTPIFYIKYPKKYSQQSLKKIINQATIAATKQIPLRPNAVDALSGKNIGNRPIIHFEEGSKLEIVLMLKGGGSENISAIYQLPNVELDAHRDLAGVKKCIIDAVFKAQGKGCPPYIVGVAIGGNIEEVAYLSKKQLLRKLNDTNSNAKLKKLENRTLKKINQLNIGPLGLGGKTTALAVKIASAPRHSATFFVGVAFGCWCMRRQSL